MGMESAAPERFVLRRTVPFQGKLQVDALRGMQTGSIVPEMSAIRMSMPSLAKQLRVVSPRRKVEMQVSGGAESVSVVKYIGVVQARSPFGGCFV